MASFKDVLKGIVTIGARIVGVEQKYAPLVGMIPGIGPAINAGLSVFNTQATRWLNAIGTVEAQSPVGGGQIKADSVVADFEAGLEMVRAVADLRGEDITYDEVKLRSATSRVVDGLNEFSEVYKSIKFVPRPKAVPAPPPPPKTS